jgi:adenosylhomocysteine nucleosidase
VIIAVVGLEREARIAAGEGVRVIIGAGRAGYLRNELEAALSPRVRGIISTGIAGALSPMLMTGDCIIASAVHAEDKALRTDERWTAAMKAKLSGRVPVRIVGTDSIVATANEKRRLFARTAAHAVDTESHIVATVATPRKIPFVAFRVIVDTANTDLPAAALCAIRTDGSINNAAVVRSLISHPDQIPQLIRTGQDSRIAFRSLLRCRKALGLAFGFPEFG